MNGDGIDDLIVGAFPNDAGGSNAGAAYVVFGTTLSVTAVDLDAVALGTGGFRIIGEVGSDNAGVSVSSAWDVNGDGIDDLLGCVFLDVMARRFQPNHRCLRKGRLPAFEKTAATKRGIGERELAHPPRVVLDVAEIGAAFPPRRVP